MNLFLSRQLGPLLRPGWCAVGNEQMYRKKCAVEPALVRRVVSFYLFILCVSCTCPSFYLLVIKFAMKFFFVSFSVEMIWAIALFRSNSCGGGRVEREPDLISAQQRTPRNKRTKEPMLLDRPRGNYIRRKTNSMWREKWRRESNNLLSFRDGLLMRPIGRFFAPFPFDISLFFLANSYPPPSLSVPLFVAAKWQSAAPPFCLAVGKGRWATAR